MLIERSSVLPNRVDSAVTVAFRSVGAGTQRTAARERQQLAGELAAALRCLQGVIDQPHQLLLAVGSRLRNRSSAPITAVSRLLKSWATPPASWPTACSLCDRRRLASLFSRSAISICR